MIFAPCHIPALTQVPSLLSTSMFNITHGKPTTDFQQTLANTHHTEVNKSLLNQTLFVSPPLLISVTTPEGGSEKQKRHTGGLRSLQSSG